MSMSSPNPENRRSKAEVEHLNKLEAIVRRGLDTDLEVGNALAEISDTGLYRATHPTFEAYLRDRWGMSRPGTDGLAIVWEQARQEFGADDVTAVDIQLTVYKRQPPSQRTPDRRPSIERAAGSEAGALLRQLRRLMTESSGTIANITHQLDTRAAELDDDACDQLRDDVLVLDEDFAALKARLVAPVDWDAAHGRLIAGEVPPFEEDSEKDDAEE